MDGKKEDGDFEASAFEALERDFQEILQELVGDKSLEHFRLEYEKLHRSLKKSHESEKSLIKKCRELNTEIVHNAVKVQTALKLSQDDQATITSLKKEIERAWKMVETSHEKEQRAKETIHNLKADISKLGRLVEQGAGLSIYQENMVNQLVQEKNDLIKHRDMLEGQVGQLSGIHAELTAKVQKLEEERSVEGTVMAKLKEELETLLLEAENMQKHKEKLDKDLKELRSTMETRQNEINAKREEKAKLDESVSKLEQEVVQEKAAIEHASIRCDKLEDEKGSCVKAKDEEKAAQGKLQDERLDIQNQAKLKKEEAMDLKKSTAKYAKMLEVLKKEKLEGDAERKKLQASIASLKQDITSLMKDLEATRRRAELDGKAIVDLLHERDILSKSVTKADEKRKEHVDLVRRHESQANSLGKDLNRWKHELQLSLHRIHDLDRQREKYSTELQMANARYEDACEELTKRDNETAELKKSIADVKAKLGQQKNLYEAVRTDKNLYSKNLIESTEEIAEMRKKLKTMYLQIDQLKEEIKEKDKELITEHFEFQFVGGERDKTEENLKRHMKLQKRSQQVVERQQQDIKKLESTIQEAEAEQQNQRKEFEAVTSERNILGTQLIRRNEELALLFEKIKIQESTLGKGEIQYKRRVDEIVEQKALIGDLKLELFKAKQQVENSEDLKREVYHLQKELLQERTKVKALSEELEIPMNVHRWRKLEGSDPQMYELIQKVRTLQKRLISKTEEVVVKDAEIREKEKVHKDLTSILEKQPGPEILEQLQVYNENLDAKSKQMKAMASELKTYQAQAGDYKDEIERLTRELQEVKRKYFDQKKREMTATDARKGDTRAIHPRPVPTVHFMGGGFNLAH